MDNKYGVKNIGRTNAERKGDKEARKALFLKAFREIGTRSGAFRIAKISRKAYDVWISEDPDFMRLVANAQLEFGEYLEEIALERVKNPDKNRGSDVLLLGLLNANLPTKFRPQFAMSEDSAKDLIIEWRKAARDRAHEEKVKEPEALPASVEKTLTELLEKRRDAPEKEE
jgi:hypothetical protein|tara:strand:- start:134 stop:646 length:513 start_codon:yes stop_codon:yes gene_type:complete